MEYIEDNMKKIKVSVIVPIYNTEKFLEKCIKSILNQTLKEIEIILINDGSTDNCHKICKEYAEKNKDKIKYINNKNIGCSATRNLGIELAQGEYVAFVDSDDYIDKEMYEEMYIEATSKNYDVVISGIIYEGNKKRTEIVCPKKIKKKYDWLKLDRKIANPVNKIFKKDLVKKLGVIFHIESHSGEDLVFCFKITIDTIKVFCMHKAYYHYVFHENNSIYNFEKKLDMIKSYQELYNYLVKKNRMKKEIKKYFYKCFYKHALKEMFFKLLNPEIIDIYKANYYNTLYSTELKTLNFLNLKSKLLIFYYKNLVFFIRKFNLYFILKKIKNKMKG